MLPPGTQAANGRHVRRPSLYAGVALVSAASLITQITATRILSFMFWHHFAFFIISFALLGFGAAGTLLAVKPHLIDMRRVPGYCLGIAATVVFGYLLATRIEFRPLEVLHNRKEWVPLGFIWLSLASPFFFIGLTLASVLSLRSQDAGRIYFSDLAGAAMGSSAVLALLQQWGPTGNVIFAALLASVGGLLVSRGLGTRPGIALPLAAGLATLAVLRVMINPIELWPIRPSKGKDMHWKAEEQMALSAWDAVAKVDLTMPFEIEPSFSGDVADSFRAERYEAMALYQDAAAATPLYRVKHGIHEDLPFLRGTNQSAAYSLRENPAVLVIGPGGGIDVMIAKYFNAVKVDAVEINSTIVAATSDIHHDYIGRIYDGENFNVVCDEGRSYLKRSRDRYDIIQLSGVDTFAALASGAYTMSESYLYTKEAISDFLDRLNPEGLLSMSRWVFDPPRETLRLSLVIKRALQDRGITDPPLHIAIVRGRQWATTLVKPTPFTEAEAESLRAFAARFDFRVIYDPYRPGPNPFDTLIRSAPREEKEFCASYRYDVSVVSDDRPFFFQWYKWRSVFGAKGEDGSGGYHITRMPIADVIILVGFLQACVLSAALIIAPLRGLATRGKFSYFVYFASIGLAFMCVEMVTMQKLVLLLGHPSYSISVTLFSLLLFAGLGALRVRDVTARTVKTLKTAIPILCLLILFTILGWGRLTEVLRGLSFPLRVVASVLLVAPMAFMMGVPFPLGLRAVGRLEAGFLPWAWGTNAFFSVLGSVLATILAMRIGFSLVLSLSVVLYVVALGAASLAFKE